MAETTVTTTADVMETIERAAKPKSKQPRYAANAESFFGAITRWIKSAKALEQPDYATDSRRRDAWMLDFWRLEPHLAGVLNSVLTINANRGWTMTGGRNQTYRYVAMMHDQTWAGPSLVGWRPYFIVESLSYYATDLGAISETGRQGRRGPLRALYHTDPSRCKLTGKVETPLAYYPRSGKRQMWTPDDYFRLCSMPAAQEKYLNLGFSAVSRCLELAKMMVGIYTHDQEMIGARMPKGLLLLQGISEPQWEQALKAREAKQDSLERRYFGGVMTLATTGLEQLDARLVALSQLPAGFDKKTFMDLLMYGYALCFGYDPSEFWPVQYGSMGRGTEVETQHRKATGKGGLEFTLGYQENLQRLLPDTLEFMFEQRDEEGQLLAAQVAQAWADVAKTLYEAGQMSAGPLLMRDQALSLLAEVGQIPPEWTEIQEQEKISDVEVLERASLQRARSRALDSPTIQRAAALFPSQPIIRYHHPTGRVDVLWNCGADALAPSVWRGWRAVEDESEELWRDPDGEFSITEGDVDRAIDSARRRVGPEFAALLEAKTDVGRGGPGSGHHGHAGRPGEVGGSAPEGAGAGASREELQERAEEFLDEGLSKRWKNASMAERADIKREIVRKLMKKTGLDYNTVNRMVAKWADTSANADIDALQFQIMAGKEFGVGVRDSLVERFELEEVVGQFPNPEFSGQDNAVFLASMYDYTQERLAAAGFDPDDTIRLYRGTVKNSTEVGLWEVGDTIGLTGNPLQSWSVDSGVATRFTDSYTTDEGYMDMGVVLVMEVPIKSIISTAQTGVGCLSEGEFVILVGSDAEIEATVSKVYEGYP